MSDRFDHEKLKVYQESLTFISWLESILQKIPKSAECAAALDVLVAKGICSTADVRDGKEMLQRIVSMIVGLIKANSGYRLHEGSEQTD